MFQEIAEATQRHDHGVIEEEGNLLSLVTELVSNLVSVAVRSGVTVAAQMATLDRQHQEEHGDRLQLPTDIMISEHIDKDQLNADTERLDGDAAKRELSLSTFTQQEENLEASAEPDLSSSSTLQNKGYRLIEPHPQFRCSSPTRSSSISLRASGLHVSPGQTSQESTSVTSAQVAVQPSASQSIDSGFSSGVSSIALRSECKTLESLSEETSASSYMNLSVATIEDLHSERVARHPASDIRPSLDMSAPLFPGNLNFDESSESTVDKANIPLPPNDETLPAALESKTVFLGVENISQPASMEQMQFGLADSGAQRAFIPLHPAQKLKTETSDSAEYVEPKVHISKKKSKHPEDSSAVAVPRHELKHFRRQKAKDETSDDLDLWYQEKPHMVVETSLAAEAGAAISISPQLVTPHPFSGAVAPVKSSGIPKLRDKRLSCSESSVQSRSKNLSSQKLSSSVSVTEKQKDIKKDKALRDGTSSHSRLNANKALLKSHKSRYVFSDVAAPLADTRKSETFFKKQGDKKALKKQDEKRRKLRGESTRHPLKFTRSHKFIRFVNSLAEISVSQAVLEGAEILVQRSAGNRNISDELYNWFATKIVAEVFLHVVRELDVQRSGQEAGLSQSHENGTGASELKEDHSPCRLELNRDEAVLKPRGILPAKSDAQAPESKVLGQIKLCGSLKMVKFKDSQAEDDSSSSVPQAQAQVATSTPIKTSATPTFHKQSSSIPIAIRRRSSLDLPLSSSSSPPGASGLTSSKLQLKSASPQQKHASVPSTVGLTSRDLSMDVYQAAAAIVSQVLQVVTDSLHTQALSPVSSGWHGTLSSSDTAINSTGWYLSEVSDVSSVLLYVMALV